MIRKSGDAFSAKIMLKTSAEPRTAERSRNPVLRQT